MPQVYFEVATSSDMHEPYQWLVRRVGNHEILAQSEAYVNKKDCIDAANIVRNGTAGASLIDTTSGSAVELHPATGEGGADRSTEPAKSASLRWWVTTLVAIAGVLVGAAAVYFPVAVQARLWPFAPSQSDIADTYDNKYASAECRASALKRHTEVMTRLGTEDPMATAEVWQSVNCPTSWVRVITQAVDVTVEKYIEREGQPDLEGAVVRRADPSIENSEGVIEATLSEQLYAPGCVLAGVVITDTAGAVVAEMPVKELC
ncbi:YegP family protein [Lysobacter korlensis]|uniref:YegP family protein n=1 Tax=Lysobacter korlensis TaxID=553636 RepID=A0ABV6RNK0_9GAMM